MNDLTIVMLHWKRPENMVRILEALSTQSCRPRVWIFNNSGKALNSHIVDLEWVSSKNIACWPRWLMATQVETKYVATLDDDLIPTDNQVFSDAMTAHANLREALTIVGYEGKQLDPAKEYRQCHDVRPGTEDQRVDIIKGRTMMMLTDALRASIELEQPLLNYVCDDIRISSLLNPGRIPRKHVIPAVYRGRFIELPAKASLCGKPGHYALREKARRELFKW